MGKNRHRLYYVKGYCELESGIVRFIGGMGGVSTSQAWYHIIYALRKPYNIDYWIDPVMEKCETLPSTKNHLRYGICKKFHCTFEPYPDGKKRHFRKFTDAEKRNFDKVDGSQLPTFEPATTLPTFDEEELHSTERPTNRMSLTEYKPPEPPLEVKLTGHLNELFNSLKRYTHNYRFDIMGVDRGKFLTETSSSMKKIEALSKMLKDKTDLNQENSEKYYKELSSKTGEVLVAVEGCLAKVTMDERKRQDVNTIVNFVKAKKKLYDEEYIDCIAASF